MAVESLKEYLVKIGWNVDEISFKNANATIDKITRKLPAQAKIIASSFVKAGQIVADVIIGINEQMFDLIDSTAKLDYQTEKLARQYWTSERNMRSFQTSLDVLGESYSSLMYMTNEQYERFIQLNQLGRSLEAPKELDDYLVKVRGLNFEFDRLKVILKYASRWVVYWISQFTGSDIETATKKIRSFSDYLVKNLQKITYYVSRFFQFFYRMGKSAVALITGIGKGIVQLVSIFDSQSARIVSIITLLGVAMLKSPVTWFIGMLTALLLLIDDYLVWKQGGKSALDWSNFEGTINNLSESFDNLKSNLQPVKDLIDQLWGYIAGDMTPIETLQKVIDGIASGLNLIASVLSDIAYLIGLVTGKESTEGFLGHKSKIFDWIEKNTGLFSDSNKLTDTLGWAFGRGQYTGQDNLFERIAGFFTSNPVDNGMVTYQGATTNSSVMNQNNNMTFNFSTNSTPDDVADTMQERLLKMRQWNLKVM